MHCTMFRLSIFTASAVLSCCILFLYITSFVKLPVVHTELKHKKKSIDCIRYSATPPIVIERFYSTVRVRQTGHLKHRDSFGKEK